ncbi:UNVERIFIED_ORG: hypothetical protein GGE44_000949 [Rhizobium esperanzae]
METPSSLLLTFEGALAKLPDGYVAGNFGSRSWGVTVKRSEDDKRTWLYGEELNGADIVSFNLYRLAGPGSTLKRCEMSSAKVIDIVLDFDASTEKSCRDENGRTINKGSILHFQHAHGCTAVGAASGTFRSPKVSAFIEKVSSSAQRHARISGFDTIDAP